MPYNFKDNMNQFFSAYNDSWTVGNLKYYAQTYSDFRDKNGKSISRYAFLLNCQKELSQEFDNLLTTLEPLAEDKRNHRILWAHSYLTCRLFIEFYSLYTDDDGDEFNKKRKKYIALASQCADELDSSRKKAAVPENKPTLLMRLKFFWESFKNDFIDLLKTPISISLLKSSIGLLNLFRVYWVFCRLMFTRALRFFREGHIIEKIEHLIGKAFDEEGFIRRIEAPNFVFNALSVGFFAARFLLNMTMGLKNLLLPPKNKEQKSTFGARFSFEVRKRHATCANDVAWGVVNLLTNYPELINISASVASWLTAGFLFFDLALILWQLGLAKRDYNKQSKLYKSQMADFETLNTYMVMRDLDEREQADLVRLQAKYAHLNQDEQNLLLETEKKKLAELRITWQAKRAAFLFNALAATVFALGFSATLVFAFPVVAIVSYAFCVVAVAMYLSAGKFEAFRSASLHRNAVRKLEADTPNKAEQEEKALAAYKNARNEFIFKILKNALIPTLVIAAFAVSWQVALVVIVVCLAVELYLAYRRNNEKAPPVIADDGVLPAQYALGNADNSGNDELASPAGSSDESDYEDAVDYGATC